MLHTASARPGLGAAPEGQGLFAAAGPSRSCSWCFPVAGAGGGRPRDGKLAVSREGSGKNELKPRKMRPCWRMGGEAKGGHGEALGNGEKVEGGGRVEGGGAGRGPGTASGFHLGPLLGEVVPGLDGADGSSECSQGCPSAICLWVATGSSAVYPWVAIGPNASHPWVAPALVQSPPIPWAPLCHQPGAHHPAPTSTGAAPGPPISLCTATLPFVRIPKQGWDLEGGSDGVRNCAVPWQAAGWDAGGCVGTLPSAAHPSRLWEQQSQGEGSIPGRRPAPQRGAPRRPFHLPSA